MIMSLVERIIGRFKAARRMSAFYMSENPRYRQYDIGEFTYGNPKVVDYGDTGLKIGKFCSIAEDVKFILGGNHRTDWFTTYPFNVLRPEFQDIKGHPKTKGDLIIGNDVWIATGATILSGLTIGDGSIIGACTLVAKDVPAYSIMAGNPGRIVRQRFSDEEIDLLLTMQWWDLSSEEINVLIPFLQADDFSGLRNAYFSLGHVR